MDDVGEGQLPLELARQLVRGILIARGVQGHKVVGGVRPGLLLEVVLDLLRGVPAGPGCDIIVHLHLVVGPLLRRVIEGVVVDGIIGALVHIGVPHTHVVQPRAGDVGEQDAEGDAHQQQRLELLADAQVQQQAGHGDHDQVFPAAVGKEPGKAGLGGQLGQGL